ncbi:MAG: hypothetical protein R2867_00080 [Caldilineaceae bacterium]
MDLSIKGLRPEPEVELPPEAEAAEAVQSTEDEVVDEFADVEVLSPMELAFKRAMEAEGIEIDTSKRKRRKGKRAFRSKTRLLPVHWVYPTINLVSIRRYR